MYSIQDAAFIFLSNYTMTIDVIWQLCCNNLCAIFFRQNRYSFSKSYCFPNFQVQIRTASIGIWWLNASVFAMLKTSAKIRGFKGDSIQLSKSYELRLGDGDCMYFNLSKKVRSFTGFSWHVIFSSIYGNKRSSNEMFMKNEVCRESEFSLV